MISVISAFFVENIVFLRIIYANLFFLTGFAILLKLNRGSELKIAKWLWLLAFYAFSFGLYLLVLIFLQLKEPTLTEQGLFALRSLSLGLIAFAFMMIFWLGIRLVLEIYHIKALYWGGLFISVAWTLSAIIFLLFSKEGLYIALMDNLSRYVFALPGMFLSGYGLMLHVKEVERYKVPALVKNIKGLAYTFFVGVFLVGMIANHPVLWPARILNGETFFNAVGLPIILFRSIHLAFMTYFVIKIVSVFEVEREHRLDEALKRQVLAEERDRIARELHDGIIQSIYGVGLKLQQFSILREKRIAEADKQMEMAKVELDQVIQDIRAYIEELQLDYFACVSLKEAMTQLVGEFRENAVMDVEFSVQGKQGGVLNVLQINHILQVMRELLSNAAKHSRASVVRIKAIFSEQELVIHVSDDGIGFDPDKLKSTGHPGEKRGLENIFHRVMILQGKSMFHSAPRQGTHFEFTFPYSKVSYLQTVFVKDSKYFQADKLGQQKGGK
jgi:signal transduction histidine kinase